MPAEHTPDVATLILAGEHVTAAFRALGDCPLPVAPNVLRLECERSMQALDLALAPFRALSTNEGGR